MTLQSYISKWLPSIECEMRKAIYSKPEVVYGMLPEYLFRGGKRLRPILTLICCGALGASEKKAIEPAALLELFHNFTLIHDDIEDHSSMRRGKPTLHIQYGVPIALNSGDALYTAIWNRLLSFHLSPAAIVDMGRIYGNAFKGVAEGQGIEIAWHHWRKFKISEEEYLNMARGKTGTLIGAACELGAYMAGADSATRKKFRSFGESIGVAFQIQDDILNIIGDVKKYKKNIGGDIKEGKRTLIFIHTMQHASPLERKKLLTIYRKDSKTKKDIAFVIALFKKYNSIDYAKKKAETLIAKAKQHISFVKRPAYRRLLLEVCDLFVNREV